MNFIFKVAEVLMALMALAAALFVVMVVVGMFIALDSATIAYASSGFWPAR